MPYHHDRAIAYLVVGSEQPCPSPSRRSFPRLGLRFVVELVCQIELLCMPKRHSIPAARLGLVHGAIREVDQLFHF